MRPVASVVVAAGLTAAGIVLPLAAAQDASPARAHEGKGFEWVETAVDGKILDIAVAHHRDRRRLLLLVADVDIPEDATAASDEEDPEDAQEEVEPGRPPCPDEAGAPPRLVEAAFEADGSIAVVRDALPVEATALETVDLDGDGVDEWLLLLPDSIRLLSPDDPADDRELTGGDNGVARRLLRPDGRPVTWLANPGARALEIYRPREGRLEPIAETAPGRTAFAWGDSLGVVWRPLSFVAEREGVLQFVSRAVNATTGRASAERVDIGSDGSVGELTCWLKLPEPEDLLESIPLVVGGEPRLLLTTKAAGKLGLTSEKRLRLYPLTEDRTRLGLNPVWQAGSRMNLWQTATVEMLDADGEPPLDLVIGYWKGLSDARVVLDVYSGKADGTFADAPRSTAFNVKKANRSFLGMDRDLDGDGRMDLWVATERGVNIYRGTAAGAKTLVESKPLVVPFTPTVEAYEVVVSMGSGGMQIHPVGNPPQRMPRVTLADGRTAVVVSRRGEDGEGDTIAVIRVDTP